MKRNAFLSRVHGYNPRTLVFIDEITFSDPYIPLASKKSAPAATLHDWAKAYKYDIYVSYFLSSVSEQRY